MNTTKINNGKVFMIAHRGLSGLEPENSIPAFVAAGNRSYYGIETDIHVSKDGRFIVTHDDVTGRVAADSIPIEEVSFEFARKLRLRNVCRIQLNEGCVPENMPVRDDLILPSLKEYIEICKKYEKKAILELKNRFETKDIQRLIEEIKDCQYLDHVVFISFCFDNLKDLRSMLPNQELQFLTKVYEPEIMEKLNQYHLELDIKHTELTKDLIKDVHSNGHKVNCWTVDDKERAHTLIEWGVDFLTTNLLEGED